MNNEIISYVSYGLALLVGGICFLLVKHTADEFDRWYEQPSVRRALPFAALSLLIVVGLAVILL